jgi:hypothetical protein
MFKGIKILGISLILISFLLLIAFFATFGQGSGMIDSAAGEAIHVPLLTDAVLFWVYGLFAVTIIVSIAAALFVFIKSLISSPMSALKSLIPIVLFAGIFVVSFIFGSGEKMSIIGYEGTQNVGTWAQISDMFIYTIYTLFVIIILTIFGSRIYTALK